MQFLVSHYVVKTAMEVKLPGYYMHVLQKLCYVWYTSGTMQDSLYQLSGYLWMLELRVHRYNLL